MKSEQESMSHATRSCTEIQTLSIDEFFRHPSLNVTTHPHRMRPKNAPVNFHSSVSFKRCLNKGCVWPGCSRYECDQLKKIMFKSYHVGGQRRQKQGRIPRKCWLTAEQRRAEVEFLM